MPIKQRYIGREIQKNDKQTKRQTNRKAKGQKGRQTNIGLKEIGGGEGQEKEKKSPSS